MNAQTVSNMATSLTDTASESIHKATEKRRRTESEADIEWTATNSPKRKKSKLDIDVKLEKPANENERPITGPVKIDNLEHFPEEILLQIFARTDDVGLVNLAETSYRFAAIAQFAFNERYANRYFVIDAKYRGGDPELYWAQLNCFGNSIKAIRINGIDEEDNWVAEMLQQHNGHIKKLEFNRCFFNDEQSELCSQQLTDITHLTYNECYNCTVDLPNCHKLVELELRETKCSISYNSLEQIMQNNPSLQSLLLHGCLEEDPDLCQLITLIAGHSNHIKELALVGGNEWNILTPEEIDIIVNSFQHLESLALSIDSNIIGLLQRLGTECKSIEHLELHCFDDLNNEISVAARSFQQIESLCLTASEKENVVANIGSIIEHLPNLRHLMTPENFVHETSFEWFRKCPSLDQITIGHHAYQRLNTKHFEEFIEIITTTEKPNAEVEVEKFGEIIGSVTENGLIWRDKLLHWTGCDKNRSTSNLHLLDLVDHPVKSDAEPQRNALDLIFEYLDVGSLEAIGEVSTKSMTLVESYVERHAQRHGTFDITDEFDHDFGLDLGKSLDLDMFSRRVTGLHVHVDYHRNNSFNAALKRFELINKLTLHTEYSGSSGFHALCEILECCPNIEIIEFKNACVFDDLDYAVPFQLPANLKSFKKFIFNYRGESQLNNLKDFFKNTETELIPIY